MYHLFEAYLLSGYICLTAAYLGALLFGMSAVAPLAVRILDEANAARLLRAFWPRFYRFAVLAGMIVLLGGLALVPAGLPVVYASLIVAFAGLMTTCFFIGWRQIPAINRARDRGGREFSRQHRLNVGLLAVGLLAGSLLLTSVVYVLPGQFTFRPTAEPVERAVTPAHPGIRV